MKNRLRVILADRRIKKGEFADKVGITRGSLTLILKEERTPTLQVAMKIANALDLKIEDIWYIEK